MDSRDNFSRASTGIVPSFSPQRRVELKDWQLAVDLAENPNSLNRWLYYKVADNAMLDLHLTSIMETRLLELQAAKFKLIDPAGKEDPGALEMFQAQWYLDYTRFDWEAMPLAFSLIELFNLAQEKKQITTNSGKKTFLPLKEVTLINRAHVRPELSRWVVNTTDDLKSGFDFTLPPYNNYYIGVGSKTGLGMMKKIIPIALAKRYALAAWGDYDEKLGIPFRKVTMQGTDKKREKLLAEIMTNMGPAGWGIFHEGETVELLQNSGSDVHKCFLELIALCDKQMSKALLGSTMVVDAEGGNYKGDVHERTSEIRHEADKTIHEYHVNDNLIPLLIKRGYPLVGYKFQRDNKQELSLSDQIKIDTILLQHYSLSPEYIANKYDIPLEMISGKSATDVQDVITETQKKKVQPKNSRILINGFEATIINSCENLYFNGCGHVHNVSNKKFTYNDIERVIKAVFNKELKKGDLDDNLFDWQVKQLMKAAQEGFDKEFVSITYNEQDGDMINKVKENIFIFSGLKNYQELRAMADLLIDEDGKIKTYNHFKDDVLKVHETYDQRFLEAEYGHAVVSANMMSYWDRIQQDKGTLKFLRLNAIIDANSSTICPPIDGTIRPVDDEFWNTYYPPNHWGCRSTVDQLANGDVTDLNTIELPELKPVFQNNVGKAGIIFPDNHPYAQMSKAQKTKIVDFAKQKFKPEEDGK